MKVSNSIVWSLFDGQYSEPLISKLANLKLSTSASYKRMKNLKVLQELYEDISESRNEIVKKYGKEKDGVYGIDEEDQEAREKFFKDFSEILSKEEEVTIKKFSLYELDGKLELSNQEFVTLSFMIEDEEATEQPQ